jgi:hypothetical protein
MTDFWKYRDEFASSLKDVPGVISVGLGREHGEVVLVVAVDPDEFRQTLPERYRDVRVKIRELGIGDSYVFSRAGAIR